ncbi:MAG: hypothetical protein R3359_12455, partial [Marinirhabdus sp.]|nr:hypothetical protein [Marinirhabdus sp.]
LWHKGSGSIIKRVAKGLKYYTTGGIGVVDVRDVTKAMCDLMESEVVNQRFILVSNNVSYKQFLTDLSEQLSTAPPTKPIAKWKLVVFSKMDWFFSKLFGTKRKLLRTHVESLYSFDHYDGSKITHSLPFKYIPYPETIRRVTQLFKKEND